MRVRADPIVDEELEAAFDWYESRRPGLGDKLLHDYRDALNGILRFPNAWQMVNDTHRRFRLKRFPYAVVYQLPNQHGEITVVAFIHLHSRRSIWRE